MPIELTPAQFVNSWKPVTMSKLDINAHRFVVAAAKYMQMRFKMSFNQGFYGTPWAPRRSKWGIHHKHRVLNETGDLKNSIKVDEGSNSYGTRSFSSGAYIAQSNVHTTASSSRKKTGDTSGYAAVHNSDPSQTSYTVNGKSRRKPVQRQFMGFSESADNYIALNYLSEILLDQIPH